MKIIYKRVLYFFLTLLIVFLTAILILPYIFRDKILVKVKTELNKMLDAKVNFENINISFIRSFPNASVKLENFYIVGIEEFKRDTLIFSKNIDLVINIKSIFSDTGYDIRKLEFNNSNCLVRVLPSGKANWDILKKDSSQINDTSKMNFHWKLKEFSINNANIAYHHEKTDMHFLLENLNHSTTGDLTADSSLLITKTTCDSLSFDWDGIRYISKASAELNSNIDANLNEMIFTLSENSAKINAIPFSLSGWLKSITEGWDMDLKLNTPEVDFKSILSMIPAIYSNSFKDIKAGGNVDLKGDIKGKMVGDYYPAFNFKLNVINAWFQYPSLPKSLQNINIASNITNIGKTLDETIVDISDFSFNLGGNPFKSKLRIAYPMSDPDLILNAHGIINLGMIKDVYPLSKNTTLNGLMKLNLDLSGRKSYFDKNLYDKFKFAGNIDISNLIVKMAELNQNLAISNAKAIFNNKYINIEDLKIRLDRNDISASGKLDNFVAYALNNKTLNGQFIMHSDYFNVSDFIENAPKDKVKKVEKDTLNSNKSSKMEIIKIPTNLNLNLKADFKQLVYDNAKMTNASGTLKVADGELKVENMNLNAFGGNIQLNGIYNTVDTLKPKVNFDFSINEVIFTEVFNQIETVQKLIPVFQKASGKFSTKMSFNSILNDNMMPDLTTIVSNGLFTTKSVGLKNVPAVQALSSALKRSDLTPMIIKDLGLLFEIKDGKINTKPFNFKVKDVNFTLGGNTGLDKSIAYQGIVQLPDRMNLGKFSTVNVKIGGTFLKPKVELDLKSTATKLINETTAKVEAEVTKKIEDTKQKALEEARIQKEKAIQQAQEQANLIIKQAQETGDKLIVESKKQGDLIIQKATNPIAKKAAELVAKKVIDEAQKKANELNIKAQQEATKLIQKANESVEI